jgi:ArsR family transcriptional regulator
MPRVSIAFTYSSYVEMILSLQVLSEPGRQGVLLPWVVRFQEKISPEAYESIADYAELLGGWRQAIAPALAGAATSDLSVPAVLHALETWLGEDIPPAFRSAEPGRWAAFVKFLWHYWSEYFHEEFYWIEPLLVSSIRQQAPEARRDGWSLVSTLAPGVAEELAAGGTGLGSGAGQGRLVRLIPSVFCVYDRALGTAGHALTACYPVAPGVFRRPENLTPPEPLARLLKTLADETRLRLLKLMLEEHKCTRDLAEALGLAEPTVSRHLRRLRDVDLVEATEDGNYIYYTAKLERIAELHMKVLDFLRS